MFGLLSSLFWHIDNEHLLSRLKAAMVSLKTSATEDNFFIIIWNFVVKNLCDKISKMKNLSRQFCWIFHWLSRGVLHFFWGCCFHGEICKTKWPLFDFLEKTEKRRFWTSNFSIKTASNKIFFELILMPVPRGSFWTPEFLSEALYEDCSWRFQRYR